MASWSLAIAHHWQKLWLASHHNFSNCETWKFLETLLMEQLTRVLDVISYLTHVYEQLCQCLLSKIVIHLYISNSIRGASWVTSYRPILLCNIVITPGFSPKILSQTLSNPLIPQFKRHERQAAYVLIMPPSLHMKTLQAPWALQDWFMPAHRTCTQISNIRYHPAMKLYPNYSNV